MVLLYIGFRYVILILEGSELIHNLCNFSHTDIYLYLKFYCMMKICFIVLGIDFLSREGDIFPSLDYINSIPLVRIRVLGGYLLFLEEIYIYLFCLPNT